MLELSTHDSGDRGSINLYRANRGRLAVLGLGRFETAARGHAHWRESEPCDALGKRRGRGGLVVVILAAHRCRCGGVVVAATGGSGWLCGPCRFVLLLRGE